MTIRHLLCGTALCLAATATNAATIKLVDLGGVAGSQAETGFTIAAAYWGSVLTNAATINLGVSFVSLDSGVIGSTGSIRQNYSVASWASGVAATKSNSLLDRSIVLPTLNAQGGASFITNGVGADGNDDTFVKQVIAGTSVSSRTLYENTSLIKAIGGTVADPTALDGDVQFSSNFTFDFDPTDGIDANSFDFIGVAIHEIGHALGFVSGVDTIDYWGYPNGGGRGVLGYGVNDTAIYSALDMFRYSNDPTDLVAGSSPVLDLSVRTDSYFSVDGGVTALFGNSFSTGRYNGDGSQASHWKDAASCTVQLGIMDPSFCFGQMGEVTALDLAAYDAMGWNTSIDVLANPGYAMTTASIYNRFATVVPEPTSWALMLAGFALVGGTLRRRRATPVRIAFNG